MNFFVISIKKNLLLYLFSIFTLCLIFFSYTNLIAAQEGIMLWASSVLPSLFPFFVATELLCRTNFIYIVGKYLNKFMKPIFNVPGESAAALILGTLSGYPVSAKIVCNLKKQKSISKIEAERLIAFTNNSGPLFILGSIGICLYNNKKIGIILLFSHIISSILVGFIFKYWKQKQELNIDYKLFKTESNSILKLSDLGEILGESIKNAISTILTIGGFIVIFSVILSILETSGFFEFLSFIFSKLGINKDFSKAFLYGIFEITNGIKYSSKLLNSTVSILLTSFLLGFGGLSVLFQIFSIISKEGISIKPYFYGKFLQGLISIFVTFILLYSF